MIRKNKVVKTLTNKRNISNIILKHFDVLNLPTPWGNKSIG